MHSGKSEALISIYNKIYRKDYIIAFKPKKDTRDGNAIRSKTYLETIPAILIDDLSEIKEYIRDNNIHTIFIDEIEMLTGDVSELVDMSVLLDIDFYIAGLNMTGEQKVFGIMGDVLAISDQITIIHGYCEECNKEAPYTYYNSGSMSTNIIIGDESYLTLCPKCLRRKLLSKRKELINL
jgi:thymidine kinase